MNRIGFAIAILATVLGGCGVNTSRQESAPIYNAMTHKKMSRFPASLGLLVPNVAHYTCSGDYQPAEWKKLTFNEMQSHVSSLPFWLLTLSCVNPQIKFHLPKGNLRPGAVLLLEYPVGLHEPIRQAVQHTPGIVDPRFRSLGGLSVVEGKLNASLGDNVLEFVEGRTRWITSKPNTGSVLVTLTGRAVPMRVLVQFAKSTHPFDGP